MKLATWNVNSLRARMPRVVEWLAAHRPDVLCLQETKCTEKNFPLAALQELGYEVAHHGLSQWNGVAILSRVGLQDVQSGLATPSHQGEPEARAISALCNDVCVTSVYVPNGRGLEDPHFEYKLRWLDDLNELLARQLTTFDKVMVAGDFNVALEDRDVFELSLFTTHVSQPERDRLHALMALGFEDLARRFTDADDAYTYWDYRQGMFRRNLGMRIDYVFASRALAGEVTHYEVDRIERAEAKTSDHAPVIVELG